jgi:hypothetical protein
MWLGLQMCTTKPGFFFFFCGTGVWAQVFALARQAIYHLHHTSSPFCSGYSGDRKLLFAQTSLDSYTPILCFLPSLEWQVHTITLSLFSSRWESHKLFCLGWPETVILLISASSIVWDYRCVTVPSYWLKWDLGLGWPQTAILSNN